MLHHKEALKHGSFEAFLFCLGQILGKIKCQIYNFGGLAAVIGRSLPEKNADNTQGITL